MCVRTHTYKTYIHALIFTCSYNTRARPTLGEQGQKTGGVRKYHHRWQYTHTCTHAYETYTHRYIHIQPIAFGLSYLYSQIPKCNRLYFILSTHIRIKCRTKPVISSFSNLNWWFSFLGLFCHVLLKRDEWDWDWRLRLNHTPHAMGCTTHSSQSFTNVIVHANILHAHTHIRDLYTCNTHTPYLYTCDTGWRRLIGSPKLQIIFHKRATKYRALLRKMTYKNKGSYESSPPCNYIYVIFIHCTIHTYTTYIHVTLTYCTCDIHTVYIYIGLVCVCVRVFIHHTYIHVTPIYMCYSYTNHTYETYIRVTFI